MSLFFCLIWIVMDLVISQSPNYTTKWYQQRLDHFDPQNRLMYNQKYLITEEYWNKEYPMTMFIFAGGEGGIVGYWDNSGFLFDIANEFNAVVVFIEHRYYGSSLPVFNYNTTAQYYRYLNVQNALADGAVITDYLLGIYQDPNSSQKTPVIVFGGSYGGVLSALFRVHYPSIFDISLASSGPWLGLMGLGDTNGVFRIITDDFYNANPKCVDIVRNGFSEILRYANNNEYNSLSKLFNTCDEINKDNFDNFINWIRNAFLIFAQSDYPYKSEFTGNMPAWPVNYVCNNILLKYQNNPLNSLYETVNYYYNIVNSNGNLKCLNISNEYPYCSDKLWCGFGSNAEAWNYQQCTQILIPSTTNNITDMFPPSKWDINDITNFCKTKYGENVFPDQTFDILWFPQNILDIGSYIIWSNGNLDPWYGIGWNESNFNISNNDTSMILIIINESGHHYDLRGKNENDTRYIINARNKEIKYIKLWLNELY